MKHFLPLFFFFLFLQNTLALNVDWLGGTGNWQDPTNWSTGTVPTIVDDVSISSGVVNIPNGIAAKAKSIFILNMGELRISQNGSLYIKVIDVTGINNFGVIRNRGRIKLDGSSNTGMNTSGIVNRLTLINYRSGRIDLVRIKGTGLFNLSSASLTQNLGRINVLNGDSTGIQNDGTFNNYYSGNIQISANGGTGLVNRNGPSIFRNQGDIDIINNSGSQIFHFGGFFQNFAGGEINIETLPDNLNRGFQISGTPTSMPITVNQGAVNITGGTTGLTVATSGTPIVSFYQTAGGHLNISGTTSSGIEIGVGAGLINLGICNVHTAATDRAVFLSGGGAIENHSLFDCTGGEINVFSSSSYFYNLPNGKVITHGEFIGAGDLINDGHFISHYSGNHGYIGTMTNNHTLEFKALDVQGLSIDNNGFLLEPINAGAVEGIPFSDALKTANSPILIVFNNRWYTDETLTVEAGEYDLAANTFTPNANAVGRNEFFLLVRNTQNQSIAIGSVKFTKAVQNNSPVQAPEDTFLSRRTAAASHFEVYPNPMQSNGTINYQLDDPGQVELSLWNSQGQLVRQFVQKAQEIGRYTHSWSAENLPGGIYFLRLQTEEGIQQRQIVLLN